MGTNFWTRYPHISLSYVLRSCEHYHRNTSAHLIAKPKPQYSDQGWVEVMVDVADPSQNDGKLFRWVRSKKPTLNSVIINRIAPGLKVCCAL